MKSTTEDRGPNTIHHGPKTEDRGPKTNHSDRSPDGHAVGELCDYCGAESLRWRKCKLICDQCGNIVKSCADL